MPTNFGRQFLPFIQSLMSQREESPAPEEGPASEIVEALAGSLLSSKPGRNEPSPLPGEEIMSPETLLRRKMENMKAGLELAEQGSIMGTPPVAPKVPLIEEAIAIGPLGPARLRPPGMLLQIRKYAQDLIEQAKLPEGIRVFLGGGLARGFGREKAEELPSELADVDLVIGVPKKLFPQLSEKFLPDNPFAKSLMKAGRLSKEGISRLLENDLRFLAATGGKRGGIARKPRLGDREVDILVKPLEDVKSGFTGFDPIIELPMRKIK